MDNKEFEELIAKYRSGIWNITKITITGCYIGSDISGPLFLNSKNKKADQQIQKLKSGLKTSTFKH